MRKGFSLVELSIVLVILGLLTGGILAGQSLIRASELRSISADLMRYRAAIFTFRDKYQALPGDMNNATRFWGRLSAVAACVTNSSAAVATPGACDGSGDGFIGYTAAANAASEGLQFWLHLANAGLIEGSYTGLGTASSGYDSTAGSNIPVGRMSNTGWIINNYGSTGTGSANNYEVPYNNTFMVGPKTATNVVARGAFLKPEELWGIDVKLDDGRPAYGSVIAAYWGNLASDNLCTIGSAANTDLATAAYNLTHSGSVCGVRFRNATD